MLIGIIGKKQVGKDTTASILKYLFWLKKLGISGDKLTAKDIKNCVSDITKNRCIGDVEIHPVAEPLKKCASIILNCEESLLYKESFKKSLTPQFKNCKTVRQLLQILGTEVGRQIDEDIWINVLVDYYKHYVGTCLIVPDLRFENEVNKLREADPNCIIIKITRDTGYIDNHPSETALENYDKADYNIENNGTLEELVNKVKLII